MTNSTDTGKSLWQQGYDLYHSSPPLSLPQVIITLNLNAEQAAEFREGFTEAEFDQIFEDFKADVKSLKDPAVMADAMNAIADVVDGFLQHLDFDESAGGE